MDTREIYLRSVASQLSQLDSTITSLKLRVEETAPEIQTEFHAHWNALRSQYGSVENQVDALKAAGESSWEDLFKAIENNLGEMNHSIEAITPWVCMQFADNLWRFR